MSNLKSSATGCDHDGRGHPANVCRFKKHAHHFPCMLGFQKRGSKASDVVLVRGILTNYRHPCRQIEQFLRESGTSSRLETPNSSSVSRRRSSRRRLGPATKDGFVFCHDRGFFKGRDSFKKNSMSYFSYHMYVSLLPSYTSAAVYAVAVSCYTYNKQNIASNSGSFLYFLLWKGGHVVH